MRAVFSKTAQYRAVKEKSTKYDGIFYVVDKTTGKYCVPSCVLAAPLEKDCLFFGTTQKAKHQGYIACSECQPDQQRFTLSARIITRINAGDIDSYGIHGFADSLSISERQLRRIVQEQTGISPLEFNREKRLRSAKYLVTKTELPIIDVAFNVGFSSLRQFNDAFKTAYKISPREMRKPAHHKAGSKKLLSLHQNKNNNKKVKHEIT